MAGHQYLSNPKSTLFAIEDDDVDDDTFLRHSKSGSSGYMLPHTNGYEQERANLENRRLQLLERKKEIEERTIQSSQRSISLLRDSEQIGVATAEELLRQREQLERTEKRLDEINTTLRFSQKHIQGIKSVFGSLKNYLSGKSGEQAPSPSSRESGSLSTGPKDYSSPLSDTIDHTKSTATFSSGSSHPGMRTRGLEDDDPWSAQTSAVGGGAVNQVLDRNLEEMGHSITRLKGLAQGLGEEIDVQNDMLEGIMEKTEKVDYKVQHQNKEMGKLLKKK